MANFELIEIAPGTQYNLPFEYRVDCRDEEYWYKLTAILNKARNRRWTFRNDWVFNDWVIREYEI